MGLVAIFYALLRPTIPAYTNIESKRQLPGVNSVEIDETGSETALPVSINSEDLTLPRNDQREGEVSDLPEPVEELLALIASTDVGDPFFLESQQYLDVMQSLMDSGIVEDTVKDPSVIAGVAELLAGSELYSQSDSFETRRAQLRASSLDIAMSLVPGKWRDFISDLSLTERNSQLLEEMLISYEALGLEDAQMFSEDKISLEVYNERYSILRERFEASLATLLSDEEIVSLFDHDASNGHSDVDLSKVVSPYRTPLMQAAASGSLSSVHSLLAEGANVNATDRFGNSSLLIAIVEGDLNIVEALIAYGVDVNQRDNLGFSPLGTAQLYSKVNPNQEEIVTLLVSKGAQF